MINYSVGSLIVDHSMSYLITLVDNKVPMDTYFSLQDAEKMTKLMKIVLGVDNLSGSVFLNTSGKVVKSLQKSCRAGHQGSRFSYFIA